MTINIGQGNFPILSFAQANPFLTGAQAGQNMFSQAVQDQINQKKAQQMALANQLAQSTQAGNISATNAKNAAITQYASPKMLEDINSKKTTEAYQRALMNQMQFKMAHPGLSGQKVLATPTGYVSYNPYTGQTTPLTDEEGKSVLPLRTAQMLSQGPGGQWNITDAGLMQSSQTQGNIQSEGQPQEQPQGQQPWGGVPLETPSQTGGSNIQMSPASPHSRYSTAGATLIDTNTGKATSIPTVQNAGLFQKSSTGEELVSPVLKDIYKNVAPYVGALNAPSRFIREIQRGFQGDTPAYNKYTSAISTEIPQSAEKLLKQMGLNSTNELTNMVKATIQPHWNDNKFSYARRIADTLAQGAYTQGRYKKFLYGGIPLGEDATPNDIISRVSDNIYNGLLDSLNKPSPSSKYSQEDLEYTAKKHGISIDELKRRLGEK
jgi:hypothetical protein